MTRTRDEAVRLLKICTGLGDEPSHAQRIQSLSAELVRTQAERDQAVKALGEAGDVVGAQRADIDRLRAELEKAHVFIGEMVLADMEPPLPPYGSEERAEAERVQPDTEATEQADRATFKVGDRVEFSSLTPEWRDGTVASVSPLRVRADDTDNLTTEPAAIRLLPITEQAPREPLVVRKKKDCFHPWPGCNCPDVEVVMNGVGDDQ